MAPEIFESQPFDGHAIDKWALGPILFALLSNIVLPWEKPWRRMNTNFDIFCRGSQEQLVEWVRSFWLNHNSKERLRRVGFNEDSWVALWFERKNGTDQWQSTPCFSLFRQICRYDPRDRLSLRQVRNHAWMNPIVEGKLSLNMNMYKFFF